MGKSKITKAERKALEAREAELARELEARKAKKAAKKGEGQSITPSDISRAERKKAAKKKGSKKVKAVFAHTDVEADLVERAEARKAKSPKRTVEDAAAAALATPSSEGAHVAAETAAEAAAEAGEEETDAQIKARIKAKRAARAAAAEASAPIGGVTSTPEALDAIIEPTDENIEKAKAAVAAAREAIEAVASLPVVEEVETEQGREFVAGVLSEGEATLDVGPQGAYEDDFAMPSEAGKVDFETNGNNQYKVKRPSDGKVVGYTRTTTYIANLEDRSQLEKWKLRMLLEGVAANDTALPQWNERQASPDPVAATVADLVHRRDVAIAKARKADRKGKLVTGQLATIVNAARSEFKKASNELAEALLEVGGAHEKAQKGTDLHALCELYDREGIDAVGDLLTEGKITPADFDDVRAYAEAMERAGIKVLDMEVAVVNDELKVAGRLDRTLMVKFPGMARATRCVGDIKTGNIEFGVGKLAQQLEMYASSQGYDLETDERTDLKLSRTKGVVIHLPAGTGTCFIYPVDLVLGRKGNKLSGDVRAWRNEGKRAVDFKTDLADGNRGNDTAD